MNGYFVRVPELLPRGWSPRVGLPMVLTWLRNCLRAHGARVNLETNAFYALQPFAATRRLALARPLPALRHSSDFATSYTAYSGAFAEYVLHTTVRPDFEYGNKVLLPAASLELLVRSELSGPGAGAGAGAGAGDGSRPRGGPGSRPPGSSVLFEMATGANTSAATSESAMTFELLSPLGFPVYVGVAEFTSPEPDIVVLPSALMAALGIGEGAEVRVSRVALPPAHTVVLQPHSTTFHAVADFTDLGPREFLEESLTAYACLQAGTAILCGGIPGAAPRPDVEIVDEARDAAGVRSSDAAAGFASPGGGSPAFVVRPPPTVFRFNVVEVRGEPGTSVGDDGPGAVALFAGFQSQVNIEFLPAMDDFHVASSAASSAARGEGPAPGPGKGFMGASVAAPTTPSRPGGSGGGMSSASPSSSPAIREAPVAFDPAAAFLAAPMVPMVHTDEGGTGQQQSQGRALGGGGGGGGGQTLGGGGGSATAATGGGPTPAPSGASSALASAAAEREARRKMQAEAAAKRMAAAQTTG